MSALPLRRALVVLVACAAPWLTGCASLVPLPTWLQGDPSPEVPSLHESPPSDLPSPEGVRATSGELRAIPLKWDPLLAGDVSGYAIERAFDRTGPWERIAAVSGRLTTVYVDGRAPERAAAAGATGANGNGDAPAALGDGMTAYYRIRAYTPTGQLSTQFSQVASATTAPVPAPPEDVRAYSHQPRQVPLSWRASEDPHVVGYTIDRSPSYRGPFEQLAVVDGRHQTVYVDDGLGDLRVFYYRVAARNAAGAVGDPCEPVRAVTKPVPLPPIHLRVVDQGLGVNRLAWDPNVEPDLSGYRLLRRREGQEAPEVVAELPRDTLEVEDPLVGADEKVSYTVIALDRDGLESAPAEPIAVTSEGYDLSATALADGVHLKWDPRPDEGYRGARVVRKGWMRDVELGVSEDGAFVDTGARAGSRYRYVVQLERPGGAPAPPSSPVEITVPDHVAALDPAS